MMRSVAGLFVVAGTLSMGVLPSWAGGADDATFEEGKVLFQTDATPACAICHTLKDAGATGNIGPDLDDLKPVRDRIIKAMNEGIGPMPSFADSLSEEQMAAVADYVVHVTSQ